jgi:hypothetical protein
MLVSNAGKSSWPAKRAGFSGVPAGTTGLEPARARLTSECSQPLSYVPMHSAGGIRTHGLELMRLAGTATPLRRDLPGWSRTSDLRRPKPAGWPRSPTARRSNDEVGGGPCFPQTGRRVAMNASRCHPLLVGTPASHRRGPPGRCPLPLATPDARYGPRTA